MGLGSTWRNADKSQDAGAPQIPSPIDDGNSAAAIGKIRPGTVPKEATPSHTAM